MATSTHQFSQCQTPAQGIRFSDVALKSLACVAEMQTVSSEETGKNTAGGRYTYKTEADLLQALKPIAAKHGCVMLFGVVESGVVSGFFNTQTKKDASPNDKLVTFGYAVVKLTLVCATDPKDFVSVECLGFKADQSSDRALGCTTIAKRYCMMQLAAIPSSGDDDPDSDASDARAQFGGLIGGGSTPSSAHTPAATEVKDIFSSFKFQ